MASEASSLRQAAGIAAALLVGWAGCAQAAPLDPDLLTVSGRAALARGDGTPLAGRLSLGAITLDPGVAATINAKPDAIKTALGQAFTKSLKNYGYRAGDAGASSGGALPVDVEVEAFDVTPDSTGDRVIARLKASISGSNACFPYEGVGDFHALTPLRSGGGQKAFAVLVVIASAAAGWNGGLFLADQWRSADEQQAALNAKRVVGKAEGVAPQGGPEVLARYGAISSLQLAIASLIAHLGDPGGCNAPALAPAVPQSSATPSAASTPVSSITAPVMAGQQGSLGAPPAPLPKSATATTN